MARQHAAGHCQANALSFGVAALVIFAVVTAAINEPSCSPTLCKRHGADRTGSAPLKPGYQIDNIGDASSLLQTRTRLTSGHRLHGVAGPAEHRSAGKDLSRFGPPKKTGKSIAHSIVVKVRIGATDEDEDNDTDQADEDDDDDAVDLAADTSADGVLSADGIGETAFGKNATVAGINGSGGDSGSQVHAFPAMGATTSDRSVARSIVSEFDNVGIAGEFGLHCKDGDCNVGYDGPESDDGMSVDEENMSMLADADTSSAEVISGDGDEKEASSADADDDTIGGKVLSADADEKVNAAPVRASGADISKSIVSQFDDVGTPGEFGLHCKNGDCSVGFDVPDTDLDVDTGVVDHFAEVPSADGVDKNASTLTDAAFMDKSGGDDANIQGYAAVVPEAYTEGDVAVGSSGTNDADEVRDARMDNYVGPRSYGVSIAQEDKVGNETGRRQTQ